MSKASIIFLALFVCAVYSAPQGEPEGKPEPVIILVSNLNIEKDIRVYVLINCD